MISKENEKLMVILQYLENKKKKQKTNYFSNLLKVTECLQKRMKKSLDLMAYHSRLSAPHSSFTVPWLL